MAKAVSALTRTERRGRRRGAVFFRRRSAACWPWRMGAALCAARAPGDLDRDCGGRACAVLAVAGPPPAGPPLQPAGPGAWAPPFVRLERQGIWIETAAAAHALSLQWRPAPWRPASWRMWQWVVVAALGVVFSALVAQLTREVSSVATLRAKTAAMERARQPGTAKKTWARQEVAHVQAVNRAIRELNLPID